MQKPGIGNKLNYVKLLGNGVKDLADFAATIVINSVLQTFSPYFRTTEIRRLNVLETKIRKSRKNMENMEKIDRHHAEIKRF